MAATQVALKFVETLPGGEVLSEVLKQIDETIRKKKEITAQVDELKRSLPDWSSKLASSKSNSQGVQKLQGEVEKLLKFVENWKPPTKRTCLRGLFSAPPEYDEFTAKLRVFENQRLEITLLIVMEIHKNLAEIHKSLEEKHEAVVKELKEIKQHGAEHTKKLGSMRNLIVAFTTRSAGTKGLVSIPQTWRNALNKFKVENAGEKSEAQQHLLQWLEHGIDNQDAIDVSLAFVEYGDEEAKALGISILANMSKDPKMQKEVLQIEALKTLLVASQSQSSGAVKDDISSCLNNLLEQDQALFFKLWEETDCAITDERIIKRIVKNLDTDDQALGFLATLATYNDCGPVITKMKGVEATVKIYRANEELSKGLRWKTILEKVLLAIDVLASLAANEECRAKFAENYDNIWPLMHFVWNSSVLSAEIDDWDEFEDEERVPTKGPVLTPLGKRRFKKKWDREINAGEALCRLSSDKRCQQFFFDVGNTIKVSRLLSINLDIGGKAYPSTLSWFAIAAWLLDRNTWPRYEKKPEDIVSLDMKTEGCFRRIAWNLLSSQDIKSGDVNNSVFNFTDGLRGSSKLPLPFQSIFEDSGVDRLHCDRVLANCEVLTLTGTAIEQFWVMYLLLNMLTWETPSLESSHARIAQIAAMSAFENKGWGAFNRLAEHVLENSRPSDMDSSCIPFLVKSFQMMDYDSQSTEDKESDDSEDEESDDSEDEVDKPDDDWFDDKDNSAKDDDFGKKCLIRLAYLWPAHKEQIISTGGDKIVQAIRMFNQVNKI